MNLLCFSQFVPDIKYNLVVGYHLQVNFVNYFLVRDYFYLSLVVRLSVFDLISPLPLKQFQKYLIPTDISGGKSRVLK